MLSKAEAKRRERARKKAIKHLIEELADLEHQQWIQWSKDISSTGLNPLRLKRWKGFWIPYKRLPESAKRLDRLWAHRVMRIVKKYSDFVGDYDPDLLD